MLEAAPVADRARRIGTILRQQHPNMHFVRLAFEPGKETPYAIPDARPRFSPADPFRFAFKNPLAVRRAEFSPRRIERYAAFFCVLLEVVLTLTETFRLPRFDRTFTQGLRLVRHDQSKINADHPSEAAAFRTGTHRVVERKQRGHRPEN